MNKLFKNSVVCILIFLCVFASLVGGVFAVGEKPVQWMSYPDYMDLEGDRAWIDPTVYLGYTAQFNSVEYSEYRIGNVVDGEFVEYAAVPLSANSSSLRNIGKDYKVTIVDYYVDTTNKNLWYKVEALEGYTLPEEFINNPYVLYLRSYDVNQFCDAPRLAMLPKKGMVSGDTLVLKKDKASATKSIELAKEDVPEFFDVTYVRSDDYYWYGYDLGDVTSWNEDLITSEYRYVDETNIILMPVVVTVAYERLLEAETYEEYNEILNSIPEDVLEQFTPTHMEFVEEVETELRSEVIVDFEKTVTVDGKKVPVFVSGNILGDYDLSVNPVSNETVLAEGFDIKNEDDIVVALDIKIEDADGNEWQPENNKYVFVSIDVSHLGVADGEVVRLHHKHEDEIYVYEELFVTEGKVTINTDGFSIHVVERTGNTVSLEQITNNSGTGNDTIYVGQEIVYYNSHTETGTWYVEDPAGAIHYTVHSNTNVGNGGMSVRWIKIVALKETPSNEPITITYRWGTNDSNRETFTLYIEAPKATNTNTEYQNNGRRLYIKDTVNSNGTITAALTDRNGNDISSQLEGAAFSWERNDDLFIIPDAYKDNYKSVDIARDHGGLVEARMKDDNSGYEPVTYTLTVTLADGAVLKDSYTVYYQSEIINSSFEFPKAPSGTYTFFPNGYPELYWKTTAPGSGNNRTKDVEYGSVVGRDQAGYNVDEAADGNQFAELNAEAFGALYQDIITVPSTDDIPEYIEWNFSHAARNANNSGNVTDNMFIVLGPTEQAQKLLDQDDLAPLGRLATETARSQGIEAAFKAGTQSVKITYTCNGGTAEYEVWYHSVRSNQAGDWLDLKGEYQVPAGQHRTRIFFLTDVDNVANRNNPNYGNLIDVSRAGQYKDYLVEYYVEYYEEGNLKLQYFDSKKEIEEAIIYSSQPLKNFSYFEKDLNNYLYKILINGQVYPYDVRYADEPSLYIEKYPGTGENAEKPKIDVYENGVQNTNDYSEYDMVVQIYFRSTVVAIEKNLMLPSRVDANKNGIIEANEEGMTEEQKLTLMEKLNDKGGYITNFIVSSPELKEDERKSTVITNRDPAGNYKGYVAMGSEIHIENSEKYHVRVEEEHPADPEGLNLSSVQFVVKRYVMGSELGELQVVSYTINDVDDLGQPLISPEILLGEEFTINGNKVAVKIADVTVINTYEEKMTTIHYKAVGNGKVAFIGDDDNEYLDTPTEELKYYSGKAIGAAVHPGQDAVFVGWYTDPSCEEEYKVQDIHGVWDKTTNSFKPNANIISADEITFYAKFETSSLVINRTNGDEGQTFLYKIQVNKPGTEPDFDIYVSLTCGADGKGSVEVLELGAGTYTVTELTDHSWRFTDNNDSYTETKTIGNSDSGKATKLVFEFSGKRNFAYWVNEYWVKKNIFQEGN